MSVYALKNSHQLLYCGLLTLCWCLTQTQGIAMLDNLSPTELHPGATMWTYFWYLPCIALMHACYSLNKIKQPVCAACVDDLSAGLLIWEDSTRNVRFLSGSSSSSDVLFYRRNAASSFSTMWPPHS